jgi:hypothetical protein
MMGKKFVYNVVSETLVVELTRSDVENEAMRNDELASPRLTRH